MKFRVFLLAIVFLFSTNVRSQSVAQNRCNNFGKGMNISNWLEGYWQTGWPTPNGYTRSDVVKMKEAGIKSLRLAICFASVTDTLPPFSVDTNHPLFARVDTVIKWAEELDMNLIIDNHHNWDIFNSNWREKLPRFCSLWSVLAQRYENLDAERYTLELLNEPAYGIDLDSLNIVFTTAIDTIRKYDNVHSIIVSPNFSSSGQAYANYQPLSDTNLIYTWHSYDPYQFTHQGFSWGTPFVPLGTSFPSSFDNMLHNSWAQVVQWKNTYNKPVFLGEFGAGELADDVSRCNWMQYFGSRIDSFNMPWFYWDWRWDFSLFHSHVVSEDSVNLCFKRALHLYGDTSVGINQLDNQLKAFVYPNPSNEFVHIQLDDATTAVFELFDLNGKNVKREKFDDALTLNVSELNTGIYYLSIKSSKGTYRTKLLIQH
jgi:endoglucanase